MSISICNGKKPSTVTQGLSIFPLYTNLPQVVKKKKCFKMKENKKYIKAEKLVEKQQFNILNVGKIQPKAWQYL